MAGTSLAMGRKKAENIQKTGADTVVTIDTSCAMHFGGIMQRDPRMRDIRILHLAELLAQR
jgi:L-lactate dehydrogenase complex protein LldE